MKRSCGREGDEVFSCRFRQCIAGKILQDKKFGPFQEEENEAGPESAQGAD